MNPEIFLKQKQEKTCDMHTPDKWSKLFDWGSVAFILGKLLVDMEEGSDFEASLTAALLVCPASFDLKVDWPPCFLLLKT